MKKLTANQIKTLESAKRNYKEAEDAAMKAILAYDGMIKIIRDLGDTFDSEELRQIGHRAEMATYEFWRHAPTDEEAKWERVRELVRLRWE